MNAPIALLALLLGGADGPAAPPEPVRVSRGMRGVVLMSSRNGVLRPLPAQSVSNPVLVRVGEPAGASGAQEVEFVGLRPGRYDLRDFVQLSDGTSPSDLPPFPVEVISRFPPGSEAALARPDLGPLSFGSGYARAAPALWAIWAAVGATLVGVHFARRRRRRPAPPPAPVSAPTERDELMGLLDRAAGGSLGPTTLARLELLLVRALMGAQGPAARFESAGDIARSLESLRLKPVEGAAVRAVESWLHSGGPFDAEAAHDAVRAARAAIQHADANAAVRAGSAGGEP